MHQIFISVNILKYSDNDRLRIFTYSISLFKSLIINDKHKNILLEAGSNANIECKLKFI